MSLDCDPFSSLEGCLPIAATHLVTVPVHLRAAHGTDGFSAGQSIYDIPQSFIAFSRNGILVLIIVYLIAHIVMSLAYPPQAA